MLKMTRSSNLNSRAFRAKKNKFAKVGDDKVDKTVMNLVKFKKLKKIMFKIKMRIGATKKHMFFTFDTKKS